MTRGGGELLPIIFALHPLIWLEFGSLNRLEKWNYHPLEKLEAAGSKTDEPGR